MRRAPRSRVGKVSVEALVDAAALLLERAGVAGLTTNRVAELAGVSVGTLYQYFPNKEALVAALFDRNTALYERALAAAMTRAFERGPDAFVACAVEQYTHLLETLPNVHRALHELRGSAGVNERASLAMKRNIDLVTLLLRRAGHDEARAGVLAYMIVHAADGIGVAVGQLEDRNLAREVIREFGSFVLATIENKSKRFRAGHVSAGSPPPRGAPPR